jgi:AbrB family looped-hinge helix DNA binding protein
MLVKLSSKGQLVIPKNIRENLGLRKGSQLRIRLVNDKIVLEPIDAVSAIDALYAKYPDDDFLQDLEREHREELTSDRETVHP